MRELVPHCPTKVPQCTEREAQEAGRALILRRREVLDRALGWLTRREPELRVYERVRGRVYRWEEKAAIWEERGKVAEASCPFLSVLGCTVPEGVPLICRSGQLDPYGPYGFFPALLAKILDPEGLRALIDGGEIPDAKISYAQIT